MSIDSITALPTAQIPTQTARTAQDFEAMFAAQMMAPMWETVEVNETFGGGRGEEVFRSMLMQEYGKIIAEDGKLGLADAVRRQMLHLQEAQS